MKPSHLAVVAALALLAAAPKTVSAHCDTLDGPVVKDARAALEAKDVTPVLKWVKADKEPEILAAFGRALAARTLGPEELVHYAERLAAAVAGRPSEAEEHAH